MKAGRNITADIAKGLGIIAVGIYHLVYRTEGGIADRIICECIWFFIPFFFLLSGYNFSEGRALKENIIHRFRVLMLPALKYTVLILSAGGIYCAVFHSYTVRDWLRDVIQTYLRPEFSSLLIPEWGAGGILFESISPVWFIWAMMSAYVMFYAIVDYALKNIKALSVSCMVLLAAGISLYSFGGKISWSLTSAPVYVSLMLCGAYMSSHTITIRVNMLLFFAAVTAHFVMFQFFGTDYLFENVLGTVGQFSVIPFFVQAFAGVYALTAVCIAVTRTDKPAKILSFIGKNSLAFMMLHGIFGMIASDLLHTFIKLSPDHWYAEPLTPEIRLKSLAVCIMSLLCCGVFCKLKNLLEDKNEAVGQNRK